MAAADVSMAGPLRPDGTLRPGRIRPNRFQPRLQRPYNVSAGDPAAVSLIGLMLRAESSMNIIGTQVTQVLRSGKTVQSIQYVTREGDRALRLDYLQPPNLGGEKVIDDGTTRWRYIPKRNTLQAGPSTIGKLDGRIHQLMNHLNRPTFGMKIVGSDNVAGHDCQIVEVDSLTTPSTILRRFWIDPTNGAQLRIEQYDSDGQLQSVSYFTTITYNAVISAAAFAPPATAPGVNVVPRPMTNSVSSLQTAEIGAGFSPLQPTYLPPGFTFQSASVMKYNGYNVIGLKYVNGMNVLSLFETPEHDRPLTTIVHPRPGVAQATVGGFRIILVGNSAPAVQDQMIGSLH